MFNGSAVSGAADASDARSVTMGTRAMNAEEYMLLESQSESYEIVMVSANESEV